MRSINKTRFALLGVLMEGKYSGYEIKSMMQRSTSYFWRESDSTIYPMLKLLEKEGHLTSQTTAVGKKSKTLYSITTSGRKEFQKWLRSPTGMETQRNEFLLKLFFVTDQKVMKALLKERLALMKELYEEYREIEKFLEHSKPSIRRNMRLYTLQYGLKSIATEIDWLNEGIRSKKIFKRFGEEDV